MGVVDVVIGCVGSYNSQRTSEMVSFLF